MNLQNYIYDNNIKQLQISSGIVNNNLSFLNNIKYHEYENNVENTLFVGMYTHTDYNIIKSHKGNKWILWTGKDIDITNKSRIHHINTLETYKINGHICLQSNIYDRLSYLNLNPILIDFKRTLINQNKFVFIISSYNNSLWYLKNLDSIKHQTYKNWRVIYVDDKSNDNTYDLVNKYINDNKLNNKIKLIKNDKNYKQGYSRYIAFKECDDNEICCLLDGDDWLYDNSVLEKLNNLYNKNDISITYGKFRYFENNKLKNSSGFQSYPETIIENNSYQHYSTWVACHMRTGYAQLFKSYPYEYLLDFNDELISASTDVNEMMWILCNSDGKHMNTGFLTYIYNKDASLLNENSYYNKELNKKTELYRNEIMYYISLNDLKRYEKKETILIFTDLKCYDKRLQDFCDLIKFKFKLIFKYELVDGINDIKIKIDHILFYDYKNITNELVDKLKLKCSDIKSNNISNELEIFNDNDIFIKLINDLNSNNSIKLIQKNYDIFDDLYEYSLLVNHQNNSPINNIVEKVYCINLVNNNHKLEKFLKQINKYNINCEIVRVKKPVYSEKFKDINKLIQNNNTLNITSCGQLGNLISILLCLLDAHVNKYKNIIIFEDDIILKKTFNDSILNIEEIFKTKEFIYLGASQWSWDLIDKECKLYTKLYDNYYLPLRTTGFFATYINCNIYNILIKEMLKLIKIDDNIPWILYNETIDLNNKDPEYINNYYKHNDICYINKNSEFYDKCIVMYPNLVIANVEESDLRNRQNQEDRCVKMKWNLQEYNYILHHEYSYKVNTTLEEDVLHTNVNVLNIMKELNIDINSNEYNIIRMLV